MKWEINIYKETFSERLYSEWLPSFCDARERNYETGGSLKRGLEKVQEIDAKWFLRAIDAGNVREESGCFVSEASAAREYIIWEGSVADQPRKLYLWLEPIITIGAVARLIEDYDWPQSQVGLQSKAPWPFDLVGYGTDKTTELLACEVKKSETEIRKMLIEMNAFCEVETLSHEPEKPLAKNAYKKVVGIRKSWPKFFWALGPGGFEHVFKIDRNKNSELFSMLPCTPENLQYHSLIT